MKLRVVVGNQFNPYLNLSVESALTDDVLPDTMTMFLWKNSQTVVIGVNQNPYSECNVELLQSEGGHVSRRRTGGGAVYHDLGNLNFSFVVGNGNYDVHRQCSVIQRALLDFGLKAEVSGRNDILIDGRKFSGNAFYKGRQQSLHHGTILIKTDTERLQKYLKVNPAKLHKHGVKSVESRVVNLSELVDITAETLIPSLIRAFEEVYGGKAEVVDFDTLCTPKVIANKQFIESDEYLFAKWRNFTAHRQAQFYWGLVDIDFSVDENTKLIKSISIASDCLQTSAIANAERLLTGASSLVAPSAPQGDDEPIIRDIFGLLY